MMIKCVYYLFNTLVAAIIALLPDFFIFWPSDVYAINQSHCLITKHVSLFAEIVFNC